MDNPYKNILDACYANSAKILQRKITNHYNTLLKPVGLTSSQITMLLAVGAKPGIIISELSDVLVHDISAAQRGVEALEKKGLVIVKNGPQRSREVFLTPDAEAKLQEALPLWTEAQETIQKILPQEPSMQMQTLLEKVPPAP